MGRPKTAESGPCVQAVQIDYFDIALFCCESKSKSGWVPQMDTKEEGRELVLPIQGPRRRFMLHLWHE